MLSQAQIQRVWEGMLLAEMRALYYADLAVRSNARQRYATWATVVASSAALASVVTQVPEGYGWIRPALALATALLSGYALAMQVQKRAVDASDLHYRWNLLAQEYGAIWENVYAEDGPERLRAADATAAEISEASHQLPYKKRLMAKWQEHVEAAWRQRVTSHRAAA